MDALPPHSATTPRRRIGLALQGGGAHGAFTWGVLDRLLEDGVEIAAISGVSSGAIIGAMAAQGLARGGAAGARAEMRGLWDRVSQGQAGWEMGGWEMGGWGQSLLWQGMETAMRLFSPAQINPLGHHPLRALLTELLDPALLADPRAPRLTVSATDVQTGMAVLFGNAAITAEVLLASSCLPFVFPAVEIDGRAYWDGGYTGNPPMRPLLGEPGCELVLIRAQPVRRAGVPRTPSEIFNRLNEIACHAVLEAEIAALPPTVRLVTYDADDALRDLPISSRMNASAAFLARLFEAGRNAPPRAERPVAVAAAAD